jgi:hypothetical protein
MAWALLVLTALFWGFGPVAMTDPWEPYVVAVLLVAITVLAFDATYGGLWSWLLLIAYASLVGQMYGAAGVIAVIVGAWGVGVGVVRLVRRGEARAMWARLGITAGVGVLLWLPPLVQEVRDQPGNLTAIWRFVRQPHATIGFGDAVGALRLETWFPAVWLGWHVPLAPFAATVDVGRAPWFPGSVVVLLAVAVVAWRLRGNAQLWFTATVALAAAAAVVSLSRLVVPFFVWFVEPTRAAGALIWLPLGALAALVTNVRARNLLLIVVSVGLGVLAGGLTVRAVHNDLGPSRQVVALGQLARAAEPALRGGHGPVIVQSDVRNQVLQEAGFGHDEITVALALAGFDVVSGSKPGDIDAMTHYGAFRAHPERATRRLVLQLDGSPVPAGGSVVGRADPLTASERADRTRLLQQVTEVCGTGGLQVLHQCRAAHPNVGGWLDELGSIPNLPALQLSLVPVTPSA